MTKFTDEEIIANHKACTLSANMRDCNACPFRLGWLVEALRVELPDKYEPAWMSEIKAKAQEFVKPILGSAEWFESIPEVKF